MVGSHVVGPGTKYVSHTTPLGTPHYTDNFIVVLICVEKKYGCIETIHFVVQFG